MLQRYVLNLENMAISYWRACCCCSFLFYWSRLKCQSHQTHGQMKYLKRKQKLHAIQCTKGIVSAIGEREERKKKQPRIDTVRNKTQKILYKRCEMLVSFTSHFIRSLIPLKRHELMEAWPIFGIFDLCPRYICTVMNI